MPGLTNYQPTKRAATTSSNLTNSTFIVRGVPLTLPRYNAQKIAGLFEKLTTSEESVSSHDFLTHLGCAINLYARNMISPQEIINYLEAASRLICERKLSEKLYADALTALVDVLSNGASNQAVSIAMLTLLVRSFETESTVTCSHPTVLSTPIIDKLLASLNPELIQTDTQLQATQLLAALYQAKGISQPLHLPEPPQQATASTSPARQNQSFESVLHARSQTTLIPPAINTNANAEDLNAVPMHTVSAQRSASSSTTPQTIGGVMRPVRGLQTPQVSRVNRIYRALRAGGTQDLVRLFNEMGLDIEALSTPTPNASGSNASPHARVTPEATRRGLGIFEKVRRKRRLEDIETDENQVFKLIHEFFGKINTEANKDKAQRLAQNATQNTLNILFAPFRISGGRASFYKLTKVGHLGFLILGLSSAELERFINETLITPKAIYTDSTSLFKVIEHLKDRIETKPDEKRATYEHISRIFNIAIIHHTQCQHTHVLARLIHANQEFSSQYQFNAESVTQGLTLA